MEYPSINSVFQRDPKGRFLETYACPEFEYLVDALWTWTEKVDGTNMRLYFPRNDPTASAGQCRDGFRGNEHLWVKGRTDNAQIPPKLLNACVELLRGLPLEEVFSDPMSEVVLYGEGYGAGIQKSGGLYRPEPSFVLFDVRVGDWWLRRPDVEDVAIKLGLDVVPIVMQTTLTKAVNFARMSVACGERFASQWPGAQPEGIVGRPAVDLWDRAGNRITTKLKFKDFR